MCEPNECKRYFHLKMCKSAAATPPHTCQQFISNEEMLTKEAQQAKDARVWSVNTYHK